MPAAHPPRKGPERLGDLGDRDRRSGVLLHVGPAPFADGHFRAGLGHLLAQALAGAGQTAFDRPRPDAEGRADLSIG